MAIVTVADELGRRPIVGGQESGRSERSNLFAVPG
jgi:hypothetical protein